MILFPQRTIEMVVIGASAGGVDALLKLLPCFTPPANLAVAIVIHLPADRNNLIPPLLSPICHFKVKEAEPGEHIEKGTIYAAAPDYHLSIEPNHTLSLSSEALLNFSRPSIDILFDSAAYAYKKGLLGILLTGSNNDGAVGLKKIKDLGGLTVVQDPTGLEYPTMPQSALSIMKPDYVLDLDGISALISNICLKDKGYGN